MRYTCVIGAGKYAYNIVDANYNNSNIHFQIKTIDDSNKKKKKNQLGRGVSKIS